MISVLLPTYNQARFLPDCLDGLMKQSRQDFELIVCDDGSTDGTAFDFSQIKWTQPVSLCRHETNKGTAAAINSAFSVATATSQFITWISSDNIMHPNWLEALAGMLEKHPKMSAAYSPYRRCDRFPGNKPVDVTIAPGPYDPKRLVSGLDCYFGPSFLVRREAWLEHRDGLAHDYDWWLRFEETGDPIIGYYPEPLCDYRMGPWQTGRNKPDKLLADARRRQKEAMDRRLDETLQSLHTND